MPTGQPNPPATRHNPLAHRRLLAISGWVGMMGVWIGAFGAHGLERFLDQTHGLSGELLAKRLEQFDVGVRYHLVHSVVLLALALGHGLTLRAVRVIAGWMLAGLVLFSGSLYLLVATNTSWLGAITPIGGVSWIIGWSTIAVVALRTKGVPEHG